MFFKTFCFSKRFLQFWNCWSQSLKPLWTISILLIGVVSIYIPSLKYLKKDLSEAWHWNTHQIDQHTQTETGTPEEQDISKALLSMPYNAECKNLYIGQSKQPLQKRIAHTNIEQPHNRAPFWGQPSASTCQGRSLDEGGDKEAIQIKLEKTATLPITWHYCLHQWSNCDLSQCTLQPKGKPQQANLGQQPC